MKNILPLGWYPISFDSNLSLCITRVGLKWGFWRILKSTLILKATHGVNLEFKVDLKSTLSSCTFWSQPWFQRKVAGKDFWSGKTYPLYSEERGTKKQRLNPSLTKEIKTALDPKHEELIAKKDNNIMELQRFIQAEKWKSVWQAERWKSVWLLHGR